MKRTIRSVAVLGSGTMGSQIAAHCVNAGLEVLLLDLKSEGDDPNRDVKDHIGKLENMSPAPLAMPGWSDRIEFGNFEDDFDKLSGADWICEAIIEKMDVKRDMMARIDKIRPEGAIVTTNTSGLPISEIGRQCSKEFQKHFLGTHFFNPPRYMKLLELIPTSATSGEVTEFMSRFCEKMLGKGVVQCKDTPNFIANRIGIFSMASIMPWFFDGTFRAEEIDYLTGTLTGYSKAATFRTADMAGLDVIGHVTQNLYPAIPDDERREVFRLPEGFLGMLEEGKFGNKSGEGFYKKVQTGKGKEYKVIDPESLEYEPQIEPEFESAKEARKKFDSPGERLKFLVGRDDKAGKFLWDIHCDLLLYSASRIPEITDSVESIDRAMKWGFNWELGPFERWDAIGLRESVERMQEEGRDIPGNIRQMLEAGRERFYDKPAGTVYNLAPGESEPLSPPARGALTVSSLDEVFGNESAGLYDMGDGVALFEFRTPRHTLGFELIETLFEACEKVKTGFDALVIGHDGDNFTYGANLKEALQALEEGGMDRIESAARNFQDAAVGLRYQPFPVVVAPFSRTLGGGVEFLLRADRVVAHHELYAGMVEAGVGLLPAGGGTTEMVRRTMERIGDSDEIDPVPHLKEVFKTLGMAKVSSSAPEAGAYGFLKESDPVVMNRDLLLAHAKKEARMLFEEGYSPPEPPEIKVLGKSGLGALQVMLYIMHEAGYITDYDKVVGEQIARVMCGGELSEPALVPESYLLKLEREAFLELLKEKRTRNRIEHMLKTGKPLRN